MDTRHLAQENDYLVVEFAPYNAALVFSVKAVLNKGREYFPYGPLPTLTTTGVTSYSGGGGTSIPATGTIAENEFTTNGFYFKTPTTAPFDLDQDYVDDDNNMWYLDPNKGHKNILFHTLLKVMPTWLRLELQVPNNVRSFQFQDDLPGGVDKNIGYVRGYMNTVWIPGLRQAVRVGNDTNLQVYTHAAFKYRQYVVEVVKDPMTIFQILTRTFPLPHLVKWVTMPISLQDDAIPNALARTYGLPSGSSGFEFFPLYKRDEAIGQYQGVIRSLDSEV